MYKGIMQGIGGALQLAAIIIIIGGITIAAIMVLVQWQW